jgi:hypothetical protein
MGGTRALACQDKCFLCSTHFHAVLGNSGNKPMVADTKGTKSQKYIKSKKQNIIAVRTMVVTMATMTSAQRLIPRVMAGVTSLLHAL